MPGKTLTICEDKNTVKWYELTVDEKSSKRMYWAQIKLHISLTNRIKNSLISFNKDNFFQQKLNINKN